MNLLVGALSMGLLLSQLALGVVISYRVLRAIDLTADGAFGVGVATAAAFIAHDMSPIAGTIAGFAAGGAAGAVTGLLNVRLRIQILLAGILTSTALYSVTLYIMGGGELSIAGKPTVFSLASRLLFSRSADVVTLFGTQVSTESIATLLVVMVLSLTVGGVLDLFFRTDVGLAMRATGDNPGMAAAQAINAGGMTLLGLVLANGLIGLAGALFAQYQGFGSVQMGIGSLAAGLGCVLLGEALIGRHPVKRQLAGAIFGAVVFRLIVAAALRAGLAANALKLLSAIFLLAAIVGQRLVVRRPAGAAAGGGRV